MTKQKRRLITLDLNASPEGVRREVVGEKEYLVAPVVAIVECVMDCSTCSGPTYVPAEVIAASYENWEGTPITLGHVELGSIRVQLGSHPEKDSLAVGVFRNVSLDADGGLMGELWIDVEALEALAGGEDLVSTIEAGGVVQVSIGAMSAQTERVGIFGGKRFEYEILTLTPDHLAVLPVGDRGACSPQMGCGVNLTDRSGLVPVQLEFDEPAFNRGLSALVAATVKIAGQKEKPLMAKGKTCSCQSTVFGKLASALSFVTAEVSDSDLRTSLEMSLKETLGDQSYFWIVAVYEGSVVYGSGVDYFRRSFSASGNGKVSLKDDAVRVRPVTDWVAAVVAQADGGEAGDQPADPPPASGEQTEDDPPASGDPDAGAPPSDPPAGDPPQDPPAEDAAAAPPHARRMEDLLSQASPEDAAIMRESLAMRDRRRSELVTALGVEASEVAGLSVATLEKLVAAKKPAVEAPPAQPLTAAPKPPRFEGRGGPAAPVTAAKPTTAPKPLRLQDLKKQEKPAA